MISGVAGFGSGFSGCPHLTPLGMRALEAPGFRTGKLGWPCRDSRHRGIVPISVEVMGGIEPPRPHSRGRLWLLRAFAASAISPHHQSHGPLPSRATGFKRGWFGGSGRAPLNFIQGRSFPCTGGVWDSSCYPRCWGRGLERRGDTKPPGESVARKNPPAAAQGCAGGFLVTPNWRPRPLGAPAEFRAESLAKRPPAGK